MSIEDYVRSFKGDGFYRADKWRAKRSQILKRDNYECQDCKEEGKINTRRGGKSLEVHHKKELKDYPELAFEDDNLITLCKVCHNRRHERFGNEDREKGFWTEERW